MSCWTSCFGTLSFMLSLVKQRENNTCYRKEQIRRCVGTHGHLNSRHDIGRVPCSQCVLICYLSHWIELRLWFATWTSSVEASSGAPQALRSTSKLVPQRSLILRAYNNWLTLAIWSHCWLFVPMNRRCQSSIGIWSQNLGLAFKASCYTILSVLSVIPLTGHLTPRKLNWRPHTQIKCNWTPENLVKTHMQVAHLNLLWKEIFLV